MVGNILSFNAKSFNLLGETPVQTQKGVSTHNFRSVHAEKEHEGGGTAALLHGQAVMIIEKIQSAAHNPEREKQTKARAGQTWQEAARSAEKKAALFLIQSQAQVIPAHGKEQVYPLLLLGKKPVHGLHEKRRIGDGSAEAPPGILRHWGTCLYTSDFSFG
jgi:hypothetical protein